MKIGIIGAGAMGCLFGAMLSKNEDNRVYLIDVWQEHIEQINSGGLAIEGFRGSSGETLFKNISATSQPAEVGNVDLAIVFVKSILTEKAVSSNKTLFGQDTVVLTLQNGVGNVEGIGKTVGEGQIIAGTTAQGGTMISPGRIRHGGEGCTIIGELDGKLTERIYGIAQLFEDSGIEVKTSENIMGGIWDKLMVNVGINPITAITGLKNGEIVDHPELCKILEGAVKEAAAVAGAKGIELGLESPVDHTLSVCRATASNTSSMLQDIEKQRETEIDMINGAIVGYGEEVDVETPINMVLTNIIRFMQKHREV